MDFEIEGMAPAELATAEPDWTDLESVRALTLTPWDGRQDPPIRIGHHPLFEPWREQIIKTASLQAPILFGDDPGDRVTSRGGGRHAHLSSAQSPNCGRCGTPLTLCFQLQPDLLAPWVKLDGALTAAYCFECHPDASAGSFDYGTNQPFDGTEACRITVERPVHLVEFGEAREAAAELTLGPQRWSFPDVMVALPEVGALDFMLMNADFEISDEYLGLVAERDGYSSPHVTGGGEEEAPGEQWRTAVGGYPSWDQEDVTPWCVDCEEPMKLVLDYNGGLFLDGALHVFTCTCGPRARFGFVAEF